MNGLEQLYIRHAKLMGALYCIVPAVAMFVGAICTVPFREVYLLRLGLSVVVGGSLGAWLHDYGVRLWLTKHRSSAGPATMLDGALIGAAVAWGIQVLPALTGLIATNHPEEAKSAIIGVWVVCAVMGALAGSALAFAWRRGIAPRDRVESPAASGDPS